ncbi:MAG: hydantoinase/oxoprolinase family protein [Methanomassiliicoccales archaeon]|nr:MAG: hydantoinase/oxoprolinase family protein [Methanomassiliicoccales archaeon]
MRLGIDVGGTFTDFVLIDDKTGETTYEKVLTTPKNLSVGVMKGIGRVLKMGGATMKDVDYVVHGTTIGTNALIQRKGARTGLITTDGFVDVLEIGRFQRPKEGLYDFYARNPEPLVPRRWRKGVPERVDRNGKVIRPLDEEAVQKVVKFFKREKVESIAVSLLFSFLNPKHEKRIAKVINEIHPKAYVSLSSEVSPEFREYERSSTTVINAYLQPILDRYLQTLHKKLNKKYGKVDLRIMQVGGGMMTPESAIGMAVSIVNSGPAGGAISGSYIAEHTKNPDALSVDMGGTSFDICLIERGEPTISTEGKFEGFPVKIPVVDVGGIGAGGGSIAWLDVGGILNVGPQSAGSDPGPACYSLGGTKPTVTDANLVLGRLNPEYFLGGGMNLDHKLAEKAINEHISKELGWSVEESASGMIRVVNANMVKGISVSSTEKGHDVRDFGLVAFGGAGPLHAVQLAREIGIPRVVIPMLPGNFSAFGLLISDTRHDYWRTFKQSVADLDPKRLAREFLKMERKARRQLKAEGVGEKQSKILWTADMRYQGQSYELNIPVKRSERMTTKEMKKVMNDFSKLHQEVYQYSSPDEEIEIVNIRVRAVGKSPKLKMPKMKKSTKDAKQALKGKKKVFFDETGFRSTNIYDRSKLRYGNVLKGPCIVEERMSTSVLIPDSTGEVDAYGNILVKVGGGR